MTEPDRLVGSRRVFDAAAQRVAALGLELVDVEMVREGQAADPAPLHRQSRAASIWRTAPGSAR